MSLFYGLSSWHYYFSQGLPILCTTALPFALHGMWIAVSSKQLVALKTMTEVVFWTIGIYSFAGHKEWRFIHPLLPLLHVLATKSLDDLSMSPSTKKKGKKKSLLNIAIPRRYLVWLMLTCPLSIYVVLFYCSAPISAMSFFRSLPRQTLSSITVGVLMPCHSIPGQAYLHREELAHGRMWALGCEPPLQYVKRRLKTALLTILTVGKTWFTTVIRQMCFTIPRYPTFGLIFRQKLTLLFHCHPIRRPLRGC